MKEYQYRYNVIVHNGSKTDKRTLQYSYLNQAIDDFAVGDLSRYEYLTIYDNDIKEYVCYNCSRKYLGQLFISY